MYMLTRGNKKGIEERKLGRDVGEFDILGDLILVAREYRGYFEGVCGSRGAKYCSVVWFRRLVPWDWLTMYLTKNTAVLIPSFLLNFINQYYLKAL
jgi:hypothetical protein